MEYLLLTPELLSAVKAGGLVFNNVFEQLSDPNSKVDVFARARILKLNMSYGSFFTDSTDEYEKGFEKLPTIARNDSEKWMNRLINARNVTAYDKMYLMSNHTPRFILNGNVVVIVINERLVEQFNKSRNGIQFLLETLVTQINGHVEDVF